MSLEKADEDEKDQWLALSAPSNLVHDIPNAFQHQWSIVTVNTNGKRPAVYEFFPPLTEPAQDDPRQDKTDD